MQCALLSCTMRALPMTVTNHSAQLTRVNNKEGKRVLSALIPHVIRCSMLCVL